MFVQFDKWEILELGDADREYGEGRDRLQGTEVIFLGSNWQGARLSSMHANNFSTDRGYFQ